MFESESLQVKVPHGKIGRGRPRQQWATTVFDNCLACAGSWANLERYFKGSFSECRVPWPSTFENLLILSIAHAPSGAKLPIHI